MLWKRLAFMQLGIFGCNEDLGAREAFRVKNNGNQGVLSCMRTVVVAAQPLFLLLKAAPFLDGTKGFPEKNTSGMGCHSAWRWVITGDIPYGWKIF
jgi:hypothetical protein